MPNSPHIVRDCIEKRYMSRKLNDQHCKCSNFPLFLLLIVETFGKWLKEYFCQENLPCAMRYMLDVPISNHLNIYLNDVCVNNDCFHLVLWVEGQKWEKKQKQMGNKQLLRGKTRSGNRTILLNMHEFYIYLYLDKSPIITIHKYTAPILSALIPKTLAWKYCSQMLLSTNSESTDR